MNLSSNPADIDPLTGRVVRALHHPLIERIVMLLDPLLQRFKIDLIALRSGPESRALARATAIAVVGSLVVDAIIVGLASHLVAARHEGPLTSICYCSHAIDPEGHSFQ